MRWRKDDTLSTLISPTEAIKYWPHFPLDNSKSCQQLAVAIDAIGSPDTRPLQHQSFVRVDQSVLNIKRGITTRRSSRYTAQQLLPPVARPRVVAVSTLTRGPVNTKVHGATATVRYSFTSLIVKSIIKHNGYQELTKQADNSLWSQYVADIEIVRVLLDSSLLYWNERKLEERFG